MSTIVGFATVAVASGCIGALLTYIGDELHHEHVDHPREKR